MFGLELVTYHLAHPLIRSSAHPLPSSVQCTTFLKLVEKMFSNSLKSLDAHLGVLYGLGTDGVHELKQMDD